MKPLKRVGLRRIRASLGATRKRQRVEAMVERQRALDDRSLKNSAWRAGYDAKQAEFTKLVQPKRGVVLLEPPPTRDRLAVAVPDAPEFPVFDPDAKIDPSRCVGIMYFRAKRVVHDVGNGAFAAQWTWEPEGGQRTASALQTNAIENGGLGVELPGDADWARNIMTKPHGERIFSRGTLEDCATALFKAVCPADSKDGNS